VLSLQVASTSVPSRATNPSPIDGTEPRMRPRTRSVTPEKPKPPPVASKPPLVSKQGIPPKPPRVKPRTQVSGHLGGEQREGKTPTPPNSRDDTSSNGSDHPPPPQPLGRKGSGDRILPSPVKSFSTKTPPSPVREPTTKPASTPDKIPSYPARPPSVEKRTTPERQVAKMRPSPDRQITNTAATDTSSAAKHVVVDSVSSQKPAEAAIKVNNLLH